METGDDDAHSRERQRPDAHLASSFAIFVVSSLSHPLVCTECTDAVHRQFLASAAATDPGNNNTEKVNASVETKKAAAVAMSPPLMATLDLSNTRPLIGEAVIAGDEKHQQNSKKRRVVVLRLETVELGRARLLRSKVISPTISTGRLSPIKMAPENYEILNNTAFTKVPTRRHLSLLLELPQPLGGPVELHPRDGHTGLACMIDGSLALFHLPQAAFYETLPSMLASLHGGGVEEGTYSGKEKTRTTKKKLPKKKQPAVDDLGEGGEQRRQETITTLLEGEELNRMGNLAYLVPPPQNNDYGHDYVGPAAEKQKQAQEKSRSASQYFTTCAAFGKHGVIIWAVTK